MAREYYESLVAKVERDEVLPEEDNEELVEGVSQLEFEDGTIITLVDKENDVWTDGNGNNYNSNGDFLEL